MAHHVIAKRAAAAVAGIVLMGLVLAVSGVPRARAAADATRAATTAASATLVIRTVPAIAGVRVILDGLIYRTDTHGFVAIPTTSGGHRVHVLPPDPLRPGVGVRFSRWLDGIALSDRRITLSPGTNNEEIGFVVSHPMTVAFTDEHRQPVPSAEISRVTMASSLGQRFTFTPAQPPRMLAANRVVRDQNGLHLLPIRYSVHDVLMDNSNVVYGGSQNFFVRPGRPTWTIRVLLFRLRVEVRDAVFGFPIGSAVRLRLPSGGSRLVPLGPGHAVVLRGLPRATYTLVAHGPGFGLSAPTTLSKPQRAKLLLLSWVDLLVAAAFAVFFLIGLPLAGGRLARHRRGKLWLVWHPTRSKADAQVAGPEAAASTAGDVAGDAADTLVMPALRESPPSPDSHPQDRGDAAAPSASPPQAANSQATGWRGLPARRRDL